MLYGKASSYYGFLPAASNVRMSVFAVSQYSFLLLSPYHFASFRARYFIIKKKCVKIVTFSAYYV